MVACSTLRLGSRGRAPKAGDDTTDLSCPFYGHFFRSKGTLGVAGPPALSVDAYESELLALLWKTAADTQPGIVPAPDDWPQAESLARYPQFFQRGLNILVRIPFFANISEVMTPQRSA